MAQQRFLDFGAPESTELLNGKWLNAEGEYIARGLDVSTSTSGPWQVDISSGVAVVDGVAVEEASNLTGQVTIDSANASDDRYDIIVVKYEYEAIEDGNPPKATYTYRKGTPAGSPTPPNPGTDEVKLADVFVPAGSTEISDLNISNVGKWAQGVSGVFDQGDQSKTFSADGMKSALLNYEGLFAYGAYGERPEPWRYPGLVYYSTDKGIAHYSDGNAWNGSGVMLQSGLLSERPNADVENMVYIRLDTDDNVQSIDWCNGTAWKSASLGGGSYALDPHGNEAHDKTFLAADSTHGNAQHNPDFAELPHDNAAHSTNYSDEGHTHAIGDLSDVTAAGEGSGNGLNSDQVDGEEAADFASAIGSSTNKKAKAIDWSNVDGKPSDYSPSDHSSKHESGGSDPLPWGSGNGLDVDMVDGMHASDLADVSHTHSIGDLSDITATGEGDGNGLNADLLDGQHASAFQSAGDYASDPHGNEAHSSDFLTQVTSTEQIHAGQMGSISAVSNLLYPIETDSDYVIKKVVVRARTAPSSNVPVTFKQDGASLEQVTLSGGSTRSESTSLQGTSVSAGSYLGFSVDSSDDQGKDLMAMVVLEEVIS